MFVIDQEYRRRDLHDENGGQRQGGISTPARHPIVLLFTSEAGQAYGYRDGWEEGVFLYTGEGQSGNMGFVRGNRAILNHAQDGKDLHLFQQMRKGYVKYVGQMVCTGYRLITGPDVDSHQRQTIVFELKPVEAVAHAHAGSAEHT